MTLTREFGILAFGAAALVLSAQPARAADGTWTNLENAQLWGTAGNWSNNIIADGSGSAADFSTLDIEADTMVRMDAPRTMSSLTFGDTRPTNKIPAGWILDGNGNRTNVLTLAGAYTITVNTLSTGRCVAINVPLAGGSGLIKAGPGTLSVAGGGNNSLPVGQALVVNGGTLDIGASSQYVGSLSGAGGWITGSGTLTISQGSSLSFNGSFSNAMNLVKAGGSTLTLTNSSPTTGTISVVVGGLTLRDSGALVGTAGLRVKGATMTIDNTGTTGAADRVSDAASITLDGGTIAFNGRDSGASTETLGAVTASSGASLVSAAPGTGSASAVLTLSSLARSKGATLLVQGSNLGTSSSPYGRILVPGGPAGNLAPVNGVARGIFYMVNTDNYFILGYDASLGFGPGFLGTVSTFSTAGATDNVSDPTDPGGPVVNANKTINSFRQGNLTFSNGTPTGGADLLTIASGMTILSPNTWGSTTQRGRITSGTSELILFKRDANVTPDPVVNSVIEDNGGPVSLVVETTHLDRGPYVILTAPNTYTGGTFVDSATGQGGIELNATSAGIVVIPAGGLTLNNNSVVDMVSFQGQIDTNNVVTINGGGMLRLMGTNTLAGLIFNSHGGSTTPTVIPYNANTLGGGNSFASFGSKTGILILSGGITSTPSNVTVTPLVDSGTLDLNNTTNHVFAVNAMMANPSLVGLQISSTIQNGGFTKAGAGVLYLSANNTYTNETRVAGGVLRANSGAGLPTASLLTLSGGVLETSGTLARTNGAVANHMQITGGASGFSAYGGALTVAFGSTGAPTALTWGDALFNPSALVLNDLSANNTLDFKNAINLGAGDRAINVNANTATLSGSLSGSGGGLTKGGAGTLILPVANTYNGATAVNGGALVLGASGSIANSKSLTVAAGAVLDVTAKGTYTMQADETYTLGVDSTGAGSAGRIAAAGLDITNGKVTLSVTGPLNDSIYVLATYTSLTGGKFASFGGLPSGYRLVYRENYIALFSRQVSGLVMVVR